MMDYLTKGTQAMFPVYLPRSMKSGIKKEEYDASVAVNENNLNQNFSILYQKILELENRMTSEG